MWTTTSVFAVLWIVPFVYFLFKNERVHNKILETIGKASFNVFLIQKLFYWQPVRQVYSCIENRVLQLVICYFICLVVGVAFYKVEMPITTWIVRSIITPAIK